MRSLVIILASSIALMAFAMKPAKGGDDDTYQVLTDEEASKLEIAIKLSNVLTDQEKFEALKGLSRRRRPPYEAVTSSTFPKGETTPVLRNNVKRDTATDPIGASSHWCCIVSAPTNVTTVPLIKAKLVDKSVPWGSGSYSCGWWSRCSLTTYKTIQVLEYYTETQVIEYPVESFICPDDKIKCCSGYVYYPKLDNCLTNSEVDALLKIANENGELFQWLFDTK